MSVSISNVNNDVIIVGAGPVGLATAATLKSLNKNLNITVLEKRPANASSPRNHVLKVEKDAIQAITSLLDKALKESANQTHSALADIKTTFQSLKKHPVRISQIEEELSAKVKDMGVRILRGPDHQLTPARLSYLMKSPQEIQALRGSECTLEDAQKESVMRSPEELEEILQRQLRDDVREEDRISPSDQEFIRLFKHTKVIVGSDSKYSAVRENIIKSKVVDEETMQHVIRLRFVTSGATRARNKLERSEDSCLNGHFEIERLNGNIVAANKVATLDLFVSKETFDVFHQVQQGKVVKGSSATPWKMPEIENLARSDDKAKKIYKIFSKHLEKAVKRNGTPFDITVTTLPLSIYRSETSVRALGNRVAILTGDSNSGMILERGLNKGFIEAALSAQTINTFFKEARESFSEIPKEFVAYQKKSKEIYDRERWWAQFKSSIITAISLILKLASQRILHAWSIIEKISLLNPFKGTAAQTAQGNE